jgi:hypothetical protein
MGAIRSEELKYIQALADLAPTFIEPGFGPNSCIPTTRILVDALEALGTKARALAVRVEILNAAYVAAVKELGRPFSDLAEAKEWQRSKGVYSYGFGTAESPGRWPGHLVVVIRQRALLDLTIAQADHPEYGIVLEPIFAEVSGRFLNGLEPAVILNNGCEVRYHCRPADRSYEETPNWRNRECIEIARELEHDVRDALK